MTSIFLPTQFIFSTIGSNKHSNVDSIVKPDWLIKLEDISNINTVFFSFFGHLLKEKCKHIELVLAGIPLLFINF